MNLPNKITVARIGLAIIVIIMMLLPWSSFGVNWPEYLEGGISLLNIITAILFAIAAFTDFLDGYLARKNKQVTDFGKVADAIADKVLVNAVLIILSYQGAIPIVIPVIIITRDIVVDSLKMLSGNKGKVVAASILGKLKTICMLVGITLVMFNNLPFELISIPVADILIILATILSVISGCQYYYNISPMLFPKNEKKAK